MISHHVREAILFGVLLISMVFIICTLVCPAPPTRIPPCLQSQTVDFDEAALVENFLVKPQYKPGLFPNITDALLSTRVYAPSPNPKDIFRAKFFEPRMSVGQRGLLTKYLNLIADIMRTNNLEDKWFLSGGTLLGSLRHHDLIPWDDDADVLVDIKYRGLIQRAIESRRSEGFHVYKSGYKDKVYMSILPSTINDVDVEGTRQVSWRDYGWPFLDICYYKIEGKTLHELESYNLQHYSYLVDDVFPLVYRPFGEMWVPTPKRAVKVLVEMYPRNVDCIYNGFSHLAEWRYRRAIAACGQLAGKYAFVRRCPMKSIKMDEKHNFVPILEQLVSRSVSGSYRVIYEIPTVVHSTEVYSHFDPLMLNWKVNEV
ncbi:unnamed protein product [Mesocestoides corti]|uniref:LicD/FKTN/FKRP nucleotidyltransferase domain-containing protein n=2 Tax=Mesocestoides corti TaxID=53468 RepID=A0A0R3UH26_MESCO|nr:unnamed protein product [Mesocestoides corti]